MSDGPDRLRILMLADFAPNPDSGAAGTEFALATELRRQGHELESLWADCLPHHIRHWNLYHLFEQPGAIRALLARRYTGCEWDVLHVNQPAGWAAAREHLARRRPALFVHRSHGFEPRVGAVVERWRRVYPEDRRPALRRLASRVLDAAIARNYRGIVRFAEAHVVSCGECADDLVARGVARERVHVSPQVPTADYFASPAPRWTRERGRRLLFVGQHVFFKAPMVLAEAVERLLGSDPALEMTWICEAAAHAQVRSRLGPAGLARVRLRDWMPREQLRGVFDTRGLFLFPSFTEGFGKVFLEAMARGLCVVSSDQGGARDVIRSGENGVLVPVGDAEALAREARKLIDQPERAAAMADSALRTAKEYTWERVAGNLASFYRQRLAAKAAS